MLIYYGTTVPEGLPVLFLGSAHLSVGLSARLASLVSCLGTSIFSGQ